MGNKRLVCMKEEINLPDPTNAHVPLPHADAERWADLQKLLKHSIKRYEDLIAIISRVSAQEAPAMAPLKEGRRASGSFSGSSPQREPSITNVVRNLSLPTLAAATYSLAAKDANFWTVTMKYMQQLVLDLPELFPEKTVPFLAIKSSVTLTAKQSACLIACGFFCIYPVHRTVKTPAGTILEIGSLNFEPLFSSFRPDSVAKLMCIYAYFTTHAQHKPDWNVTLSRHDTDLKALPDWQTSTKPLTPLHVSTQPQGERMSDVPGIDPKAGVKGKPAFLCFASKLPGGKVLGDGTSQEEVAFAMRPDALLALLLCAPLLDTSALYIIGAIKYGEIGRKNNVLEYLGEADTDDDELDLDEKGRPNAYLVCIDPTPFQTFADQKPPGFPDTGIPFTNVLQLHEKYAMRELNKLYTAFCGYFTFNRPTSTGPWGCGPAYTGVPELKLLLQWMAASEAGAVMSYAMRPESKLETSVEWGDGSLSAETIIRVRDHISSECKTVGDVWRLFVQARELYGKFPGVEWLLVKCPPLPPPAAKKPAAAATGK